MYQQFYQRFLTANKGKQHFACHSHHYWPDVSRDAMLEYWDDSARLVDDKWHYIFSEKVPQTQQLITCVAGLLALHLVTGYQWLSRAMAAMACPQV